MEMSKAIISGSGTALSLVKTLLTTPLLYEEGDLRHAVPIEAESYSQNASAQVSESLVITVNETETDGLKKYMTDNVAPSGWSWQIQGYIAGLSLLEPVNFYPWVVIKQRKKLREFFENGKRLIFKDIEFKKHTVVIENLNLQWQSDCRNKQPITITLKEINVMSTSLSNSSVVENATPPAGDVAGGVANAGVSASKKVSQSSLRKLLSSAFNFFSTK